MERTISFFLLALFRANSVDDIFKAFEDFSSADRDEDFWNLFKRCLSGTGYDPEKYLLKRILERDGWGYQWLAARNLSFSKEDVRLINAALEEQSLNVHFGSGRRGLAKDFFSGRTITGYVGYQQELRNFLVSPVAMQDEKLLQHLATAYGERYENLMYQYAQKGGEDLGKQIELLDRNYLYLQKVGWNLPPIEKAGLWTSSGLNITLGSADALPAFSFSGKMSEINDLFQFQACCVRLVKGRFVFFTDFGLLHAFRRKDGVTDLSRRSLDIPANQQTIEKAKAERLRLGLKR